MSSIGLLNLFADEWPRLSFAMLRKGKPASFRLFPVGSYVVVCGPGSFLPTLFGLLKAIRWCCCHHASCAGSTPSTNALASDSLSAGGPLGLIGGPACRVLAAATASASRQSGEDNRSPSWAISSANRRLLSSSSARDCRHCRWPCRRFNPRIRLSVPGKQILQSTASASAGALTCPFRKSYPDVLVVQSSQDGNGGNGARSLDRSMQRRIFP